MKKTREKLKYRSVMSISKTLAKIFSGAFYVVTALAVLSLIVAGIVAIVNVEPKDMLLPPYMSKVYDDSGALVSFTLSLGNGVAITRSAALVSLTDIKTVVYGFLGVSCATLCALAPAFRALARLLGNVGRGDVFAPANATCIGNLGITVIAASVVIEAVSRVANYFTYKAFVDAAESVSVRFGVDLYGVVSGALIVFIAYIYAYACACSNTSNPTAVVRSDTPEEGA